MIDSNNNLEFSITELVLLRGIQAVAKCIGPRSYKYVIECMEWTANELAQAHGNAEYYSWFSTNRGQKMAEIPSASDWLSTCGCAASKDWKEGWNALRGHLLSGVFDKGECQTRGGAGVAPSLAPHLPKVMDEEVLERAKTLYANSPDAYRGTRPLPWPEAPLATRKEFIEKAKAALGVENNGHETPGFHNHRHSR